MAKLAVLFVIMATFLSVISLAGDTSHLSSCYKSPHVLISTVGNKLKCHACHKCPKEMGMSVNCEKQIVSATVNIACVDCVTGVNYSSTNDYSQCKPCPNICENQEVKGECAKGGDNRECVPCKEDWYYDKAEAKCLPCSCRYMNQEAKQKCSDNGFHFELRCKNPTIKPTNPRSTYVEISKNSWNAGEITLIVLLIALFVGICGYCCLIGKRLKRFKVMKSRWPMGAEEWIGSVFCCRYCVTSPERHVENHVTVNVDLPEFKPTFGRQNSCPVTQDELEHATKRAKTKIGDFLQKGYYPIAESDSKENIFLTTNAPRECLKEKFKVLELNSGIFSELCNLLNVHETLGFDKLAGLMDCSVQDVKLFAASGNAAGSLLETWGTKRGNNVIELIKLLRKMGRDDLAGKLQEELNKVSCQCANCSPYC